MPYATSDQLSSHYTLGDLTRTSQALTAPNMPSDGYMYDNLVLLADVLEQLRSAIGPFTLLSGFRTSELQQALTAAGDPTSPGLSFHELGRAVDISPTSMGLVEYFSRILVDPDLKAKFAEVAIKTSQNALHLSINTPDDTRDAKVLGLNSDNVYARLSADDIANYIAPYLPSDVNATDYAAANLVTYDKTPIVLGMLGALVGAYYFLVGRKKSA
jgi:hypothetical protein